MLRSFYIYSLFAVFLNKKLNRYDAEMSPWFDFIFKDKKN